MDSKLYQMQANSAPASTDKVPYVFSKCFIGNSFGTLVYLSYLLGTCAKSSDFRAYLVGSY
jgi:hypothetical protein